MFVDNPSILTTIVIVNWNTRELLYNCLKTILDTTSTTYQIWVVDNASTDGSAEMVNSSFPQVNLIANPKNDGFAAANNLAIRQAQPTEYVLLLNPDTEVKPGSLDALVAFLQQNPTVGATGVQLLNPDGTNQRSYDYFYNFFASFWRNLLVKKLFHLTPGTVEQPDRDALEVDWIIGACLMLRNEALREVGLLDESFFMYGEEVDLQQRLRKRGWKIMLLPKVSIVHYGGQSSKQASLKMMIQEYRSRYLLIRKHNSFFTLVMYLIKALVGLIFWAGYWGAKWVVRRDEAARQSFKAYLAVLTRHLKPEFYQTPVGVKTN